ncbi:lysophospholipid acyltransferase family protein [Tangfeifania diversioriginum]|nr:lysophospholipid acyltransferase family protein [Tangfeifania diversioriginum]
MKPAFTTDIGLIFLKQIARMPFKIIYFLSDILFVMVYYIAGYRKNVVQENLRKTFPEKQQKEINQIAKKYYRHLCDLIVETIKMGGMTEKDFRERMIFKNTEQLNNYYEKGRSVVVLTMHYNNWEWSSCLPLSLKHKILGVYKPLHNPKFDAYLNQSREKTGASLISNSLILRTLIAAQKNSEPVFTWLAADQTPPFFHKFWMVFLNRETMFYPGPASISKRFNHPVFFQKIIKKERGKYESEFELLFENPKDKSEAEIMKVYINKMEGVIYRQPEYYLWSHKRWKYERPEGVPLQG